MQLLKVLRSFGFALRGLQLAWQSERNFRIECVVGLLVLVLGGLLKVNLVPLLLCCALVLCLELINSALESLVDLVSPDTHPLAKRAKDMAAGAVLLAAVISAIIGILHLAPALWHILF